MSTMMYGHIEYHVYERWLYFAEVHVERSYPLYDILRQTRRGVPSPMSPRCFHAWSLYVTEEENNLARGISRRRAESLTVRGKAEWINEHFITDPDFHSPSWANLEELTQMYETFLAGSEQSERLELPTVRAALAAMSQLPNPRLIYWFDN